jgi:hypothetical protein
MNDKKSNHGNKKDNNKGVHKMPDGTLMSGKVHTKDSRVIARQKKKAPMKKKNSPKKNTIKIGDTKITMEEGRLRKDLEMPEGKLIPMAYLKRIVKIPNGDMFQIEHGSKKMKKMTPALKKRVSLAITLKGFKKK